MQLSIRLHILHCCIHARRTPHQTSPLSFVFELLYKNVTNLYSQLVTIASAFCNMHRNHSQSYLFRTNTKNSTLIESNNYNQAIMATRAPSCSCPQLACASLDRLWPPENTLSVSLSHTHAIAFITRPHRSPHYCPQAAVFYSCQHINQRAEDTLCRGRADVVWWREWDRPTDEWGKQRAKADMVGCCPQVTTSSQPAICIAGQPVDCRSFQFAAPLFLFTILVAPPAGRPSQQASKQASKQTNKQTSKIARKLN